MESNILIRISVNELRHLIRTEVKEAIRDFQKMPSEPEDKILTIQEAAEFLRLSVPTIYSKVSRGEVPFMKRSKRLYFSQKELTEYLKKGRRKPYEEIREVAESYLNKKKCTT